MNRGFSLVELVLSLLVFQVGILAVFGMILLSQRNLQRAELTLRGILEAGWIADSLFRSGSQGDGSLPRPWGEIHWSEDSEPVPGLMFHIWSPTLGDTLSTIFEVAPAMGFGPGFPVPPGGEGRW
jgi:hypothetical protein